MATQPRASILDSSAAGTRVRDLAANVAGAAARAKHAEIYRQGPVRNSMLRVFGVHTDERAWRVGANGEAKVGRELAKLGEHWRVLHAIGVGTDDCDIDHVVIGPPGVITLNTKCRPGRRAWVGQHMVMVSGQKTDYLPKSRAEAQRAARLLSAGCGRPVAVRSAIVFVGLDDFKEKQMPTDVYITTRGRLLGWLQSLPVSLNAAAIDEIYSIARLSTTWK